MAEATIGHLIEEVRATSSQEQSKTEEVRDSVRTLAAQFGAFFKDQKAQALDALEDKREGKKEEGDTTIMQDMSDAMGSLKGISFVGMIGAILGATVGLIKGGVSGFLDAVGVVLKSFTGLFKLFVKGVSAGFAKLFPNFTKTILNISKGIGTAFNQGLKGVNGGIRGVNGAFRKLNFADKIAKSMGRLVANINGFGANVMARISTLGANISAGAKSIGANITARAGTFGTFVANTTKSVGATINGFMRNLGFANFFDEIAKSGKAVGGRISGFVQSITKGAQTFFNGIKVAFSGAFGKFFSAFSRLGRFIFFPITIIIGIIDGIKGFIQGYKEQGDSLFAGLLGGISGVLQGLIGIPLDLLKSLVGWIAGKFGMEGAEEFLASFSFAELIGSLFNTITDSVLGFFDAMRDETGKFDPMAMIKTVVGTLINTVTAPIRFILERLADLADYVPGLGGVADKIRATAGMLEFDTGVDEAREARKQKRAEYEESQQEKAEVEKLNETPATQRTETLTETSFQVNRPNPMVINQVDASVKDMSTKSTSSSAIVGDPSPAFDLAFGNKLSYV